MQEQTTEDAIEITGISRTTAFKYLRDPAFKQSLRDARSEAVALVSQKLSNAGDKAVRTLADVLDDDDAPATSKVSASRTILEYLYRSYENDELEARIEELENHIKGEN